MNNGWIKIHRKFTEWEWWDDPLMIKLWIYILLKCNHADRSWKGVLITRGQCVVGLHKMSSELRMSIKKIRTRLDKLEKTGEIGKQSNNQFTVITVSKYDSYQIIEEQKGNQNGKQRANEGQTKGNKQELKELKEEYRPHVLLSESEYNTLIDKYKKVRVERMLDKLENYKLSSGKTYDSDYGAINSWVAGHILKEMPLQAKKYHQ